MNKYCPDCGGFHEQTTAGCNRMRITNTYAPKPRIINGLYIVDESPVEALPERENFLREQYLIFERAGYERGRADMKREIGEKVKELPNINATYFIDDVIAAIEGVK